MRRFIIVVCTLMPALLLPGAFLPSASVAADALPRDEYTVKAAFILSFARLVTWPDGIFSESEATPDEQSEYQLVVGIVGPAPLVSRMVRLMDGKTVRGHRVVPRAVESVEDLAGCQVVVITRDAATRSEEFLPAVSGQPVLVVGEMEGFAGRGAVINFYEESRKIRFEVNRQAARRQHLKISSRLLGLARIVPDSPTRERIP